MRMVSRGRCGRARFFFFAVLSGALACASHGLAPRQRALESELQAAERGAAPAEAGASDADPFPGAATLERDALVAEVLRRNPSLRAARFAWRAALARFPQETALDDPMLGYAVGPASFSSHQVDDAQRIELRQAFPFPGKLRLRGEIALAEAEAAGHDFAAARLRVATMASLLFDDYYLAERGLEVNHHHRELMGELREVASARYEAGQVSAQAPLQAEFELAALERLQAALESARTLAVAQLNALLHRGPGQPLAAPPAVLAVPEVGPLDGEAEQAAALAARPELRAAEARIRAGEAAVGVARRAFLPDFALRGGYDGFWEASDLRPFLGVELSVPLQLGRRRAALSQAQAELERVRSERAGTESEVRLAVATSVARVEEARRSLALSRDRLIPAARDQLDAARAAFETGQESFLAVLQAEEDLRDVELGEHEALATLDRRIAELRSATGALPLP
jgi:outer membrane protein, heavy metal efflux system